MDSFDSLCEEDGGMSALASMISLDSLPVPNSSPSWGAMNRSSSLSNVEILNYANSDIVSNLFGLIPDAAAQELSLLQARVLETYQELHTAEMAKKEVLQSLEKKQADAQAGKEKARLYAKLLHDELQYATESCHLQKLLLK